MSMRLFKMTQQAECAAYVKVQLAAGKRVECVKDWNRVLVLVG